MPLDWRGEISAREEGPMSSIYHTSPELIAHLDFMSKTLLGWDPLLYMAHNPRAEQLCQALSTLMDFKVCAPLCLSAALDDANRSPCLLLLIELQRKGPGAFSKP